LPSPHSHAQGATLAPWPPTAAGGAQIRGGAGHPKKRGEGEGVGLGRRNFVVVVEMMILVVI